MVHQRHKSDCVIAAVANVTGKSYRTVKDLYGTMGRGKEAGLDRHEMEWLLSELSEDFHRVRTPRMTVSEWLSKRGHRSGRYLLTLDLIFEGHVIAVVFGKVCGHYSESWKIAEVHKFP